MALVHTDVTDRVAVLTLDDPDRRNAFTTGMVDELLAALDRVEADPGVGALVLTGAPPAFCAGADLGQLGTSRRDGLGRIYEGFLRIARSPLPTVAAVNGAAVGAGMNLALGCDVRLAGRRARFDAGFLRLGLHPGGGHTWMLRRIAGPQAAAAAVLFGEVIDGARAEQVGLAWRCLDDDVLVETAIELGRCAGAGPPELVRRMKATIAAMADLRTHGEAVDHELEHQLWSMAQPAFADRLAALQARIAGRPPA